MAGWLTSEEVRDLWQEAHGIDDVPLALLVASARSQCEEYASPLADGDLFPTPWRLAHLMQVQALWKSAAAGPGDSIGPDGLTVTVFPMDRTVKRLLRPSRGVPVVG